MRRIFTVEPSAVVEGSTSVIDLPAAVNSRMYRLKPPATAGGTDKTTDDNAEGGVDTLSANVTGTMRAAKKARGIACAACLMQREYAEDDHPLYCDICAELKVRVAAMEADRENNQNRLVFFAALIIGAMLIVGFGSLMFKPQPAAQTLKLRIKN